MAPDPHIALSRTCSVQGRLGDAKHFKRSFAEPITAGADRNAPQLAQQHGAQQAERLHSLTRPIMLRREKRNVLMANTAAQRSGLH